jgi:DNA-binding PadR family transcriptional regulator
MQALTPTARVILGLVGLGARTGYDVKRVADISTKFFWGASYGQIYPELRRLEEAGLAVAAEEPRGGVRRRVYRITPAGEQAVQDWLTSNDDEFGVRDEGLLKLFFGAALDGDELAELARRRRAFFEEVAGHFRGIGEELGPIDNPSAEVLTYGIELMDWNAAWWAALEERIGTGPDGVSPRSG